MFVMRTEILSFVSDRCIIFAFARVRKLTSKVLKGLSPGHLRLQEQPVWEIDSELKCVIVFLLTSDRIVSLNLRRLPVGNSCRSCYLDHLTCRSLLI
jgi:hypothetical protein